MRFRTAALLGLLAFRTAGAQLAPPQDLPAAVERQVAAREALKTQAEQGQAELRKWYESQLDAVRVDAASKANLDLVLAADAERARMDRDLTAEETAAVPKLLREVRVRYDQARRQRQFQHKTALTASLREYMITLDALEKSLTRKLDVEGAVAARKERAAAGEEISALAAPGAVVARSPSTPAGATPTPAAPPPVGVTPPVAAVPVAPLPPATPVPATPVRASSLSATNAAPAPVVQVAAELKASGTIQNPTKDAIPFETPNGFAGATGGRGVLIKNDPSAGKRGSTWSADWTGFHTTQVYFVHPHHGGYLIVTVGLYHLQPVDPSSFQTHAMMSGGSPYVFKETAANVFPLKPNQKYHLVSQLDAKGHYALAVDGQVVRTGVFSTPGPAATYVSSTPLILPEGFKGDNLPMKWKAGYAALIVGPVTEGRANLCENITFQASAPPTEKAQ